LPRRVGIIGVGWYGFRPSTPEVHFQGMMFESSHRAYVDCQEDLWEGIAITDEFAP